MPTKIKGGPFLFDSQVLADDASFNSFFSWLYSLNNSGLWPYSKDFNDPPQIERRLFCYVGTKYWYGVILSAKTNQFQHILKGRGDDIIIESKPIGGEPPLEINFFCIRQDSCKGIYSHYISAYPFGEFLRDLWNSYRKFVKLKKEETLIFGSKPQDEIDRDYSLKGKANSGPLYSPKEFDELLKKLKNIEEVRFTTYELSSEDDEPAISGLVKRKSEVYSFDRHKKIFPKTLEWIKSKRSISFRKLTSGKMKYIGSISGYDNSENPIKINFEKTLQDLLEYDYDNLGSIKLKNLRSHEIIQSMASRLRSDALFFPDI